MLSSETRTLAEEVAPDLRFAGVKTYSSSNDSSYPRELRRGSARLHTGIVFTGTSFRLIRSAEPISIGLKYEVPGVASTFPESIRCRPLNGGR
jgi:hypothetical protein